MKKNKIMIAFVCTLLILLCLCTNSIVLASQDNCSEIMKIATANKIVNPEDQNFYLKSLTIDNYDMYPEFNKNTNHYYVSIPTSVNSLDVTAETESENASVKIAGNSKLSKTENTITIDVTAKNREVKRYTITVTKQSDNGLKLDKLEIEGAELEPEFSENKYYYKTYLKLIKEEDKLKPLNITATPNDESATVTIFGNEEIVEGDNLITIMLTNEDKVSVYQVNASITSQTMVESFQDTSSDFVKLIDKCKEEIVKWFEDEHKRIATIIAGIVVVVTIVILVVVNTIKKQKQKKNAEKLKNRAR